MARNTAHPAAQPLVVTSDYARSHAQRGFDLAEFVRANTRNVTLPLLPEIRLHLAGDVYPLWKRIQELRGEEVPLPYWAYAWSGGQALARHVLDHPEIVRTRRVLDLGSGSGLVGIAAALAGAASTHCAEMDPIARVAIALNGRRNGVRLECIRSDILEDDQSAWNIVLAGDLFYEAEMSSRVLRFLACQAEHGVTILAGDPGRQFFPRSRFRKLARYNVPVMLEVEDGPVKPVGVWALGRESEEGGSVPATYGETGMARSDTPSHD